MKNLQKIYDELQLKYGASELSSIYGGGCETNPKVCLVYMNPTSKNIASNKDWQGLRYQWLGIKQVWKFLTNCGLFDNKLNEQIQKMHASEWTPEFCEKVYSEVTKNGIYITNLAKCTQTDAKHLSDSVFKEYMIYLLKELDLINPQKVVCFGNQVSSILLNQPITVSTCRKQKYQLKTSKNVYDCYPVFYPVGNGFRNIKRQLKILNLF